MSIKLLAKEGNAYLIGRNLEPLGRAQKADLGRGKVSPILSVDQFMRNGQWEETEDNPDVMSQIEKLPGYNEKELDKPAFKPQELVDAMAKQSGK